MVNDNQELVPKRYPLVLGVLQTGRRCTLTDTLAVVSRMGGNPDFAITMHLYPTMAIVGHHFCKYEELRFNTISIRLQHVENWFSRTGVERTSTSLENLADLRIDCSYSMPPPIECTVPFGKLHFWTAFTHDYQPANEIHLWEWVDIGIDFNDSVSILEALRLGIGPLKAFFAFVVGTPIALLNLGAQLTTREGEEESDRKRFVDVHYSLDQHSIGHRELLPSFMLFPFVSLGEDFECCVDKWYRFSAQVDDIQDSFWAVFHSTTLNLHHAFQTLVGVIEAYCDRRKRPKRKLRGSLEYVLTPVFELLEYPENLRLDLLQRITATRHYYAHYSLQRKKAKLGDRDLFPINELLKWSFYMALMQEVGLDGPKYIGALKASQPFLQFKHVQWPQYDPEAPTIGRHSGQTEN